jgi:sterol desaturase/sphingolipid hydroxylase (fatty acid hydroxylase superfamily)
VSLVVQLTAPLTALVSPQDRLFLGYLLASAMLAAFVLYRRQAASRSESFRQMITALLPRRIFWHPSAQLDYRVWLINHLIFTLGVGVLLVSVATATNWFIALLTLIFGPPQEGLRAGVFCCALFTLVSLMAADAGIFVDHWLQHKVPLLWEFHKVHHSAEVLTPWTAFRVHPVSELVKAPFVAAFVGLCNGIFLYVFHGMPAEITVLGVNVLYLLAYTIGAYHLQHSHIWLVFPRGIREVLCSPAMHQIHHSKALRHRDKNFAVTFTFWDRIAGTLYMPAEQEKDELELGIDDVDQAQLKTTWQLYTTPFRHAVERHLLSPRSPAAANAAGAERNDGPVDQLGPGTKASDYPLIASPPVRSDALWH